MFLEWPGRGENPMLKILFEIIEAYLCTSFKCLLASLLATNKIVLFGFKSVNNW